MGYLVNNVMEVLGVHQRMSQFSIKLSKTSIRKYEAFGSEMNTFWACGRDIHIECSKQFK
jgi:hypothetical protein